MAFLTTRVKGPDQDDWKKVTCMIRYLRGSLTLPLILRADSVPVPKWWVDGSHATHPNMHGHTGGCMSLGQGMSINTSTNKNLTLAAQLRLSWLLLMTSCQLSFGPTTFWKPKAMVIKTLSSIRTTKVQSCLKRTVASQAASGPNISIANSTSSLTASTAMNFLLHTVPWKR